jgi:hypothetical protein
MILERLSRRGDSWLPGALARASRWHPDNLPFCRRDSTKAGLDAAFLHADTAFRTAKCRQLAKLHKGPDWSAMSARQQEAAKGKIVKALEVKQEKRKRQHELEWRYKTEKGLIDSDEEETPHHPKATLDGSEEEEVVMAMDRGEDVVTDDNDEAWFDCEGVEEESLLMIGEEMVDIYNRYGRHGSLFVRTLTGHANHQEVEYAKYKAKREQEAAVGEPMEVD